MAKQTKQPIAASALPPIDWSQYAVTGVENVGAEDLGIPFLMILQKGSPQVDTADPNYAVKGIKGAQSGDIILSIQNKIVHKFGEEPLVFVPAYYQRMFMEWRPRSAGGGLVQSHPDQSILAKTKKNDKKQDILPNGNTIANTAYFFGKLLTDEAPIDCVISMTSTQLKKARAWLNTIQAVKFRRPDGGVFTPPMFSHKYHLATEPENNAEGSWHGWKISMAGPVEQRELIDSAASLSAQIHEGRNRHLLPPPPADETKEVF